MADFSQPGSITTFHALSDRPLAELERSIGAWAADTPIRLIIPALAAEADSAALPKIIDELAQVSYLDEVVIGLDAADRAAFARVDRLCSQLQVRHTILWHDGPRLRAIADELAALGLGTGVAGKGRNVWWCFGYSLASGCGGSVAVHDADITTYSRAMLARLLYPVVHPEFGYRFAKGYYARIGDGRMNGRVSRLLVAPMLAALRSTFGPSPLLDFFASFRYPLAGECVIESSLLGDLSLRSDWGLEVGLLADAFDRCGPRQVCQIDLVDAYDHKHQRLSPDDPRSGLHRMAIDVAEALLRVIVVDRPGLAEADFVAVKAQFLRCADELGDSYRHDAEMNGYVVDPAADVVLVEVFGRAVAAAVARVEAGPSMAPMPTWNHVFAQVPDLKIRLVEAVAQQAE